MNQQNRHYSMPHRNMYLPVRSMNHHRLPYDRYSHGDIVYLQNYLRRPILAMDLQNKDPLNKLGKFEVPPSFHPRQKYESICLYYQKRLVYGRQPTRFVCQQK